MLIRKALWSACEIVSEKMHMKKTHSVSFRETFAFAVSTGCLTAITINEQQSVVGMKKKQTETASLSVFLQWVDCSHRHWRDDNTPHLSATKGKLLHNRECNND